MRSSNLNIATLVLACFLAGCDSGEFTDPPSAYHGFFGFFQSDNQVQIDAGFFKETVPTPASELQASRIKTEDSCTVTALDPKTDSEQQNNQDTAEAPAMISAGETITVTSEFGTFATLTRSASDFPPYSAELSQGPVPASLSFDIPGDEFPAFTNIVIPQTPPLEFIQDINGNSVTPTTTYNWITNNNPLSTVFITAFDYEPLTGIGTGVSCTVVDDGSFSFPENIQLEMGDEFTSVSVFIAKHTTTFVQKNDALLVITTGVNSSHH